jgi:hypothetical protein
MKTLDDSDRQKVELLSEKWQQSLSTTICRIIREYKSNEG